MWRIIVIQILSIFPVQFLCCTSFPRLPFIATFSIYKILWLLQKFSNICKPEEGWYGQPKYGYKKQYIYLVHALLLLMFLSVAVFCEMSEMSRSYQMH